jgi:glycosyltransferase involved in cell wall biosynthesis
MRVIFIATHYHPYIGGIEYVVKSVAERLAKTGNDISVLCGDSKIASPKEEWINGVHVFRWPVWSPGDAYHIPRSRSELGELLVNLTKEVDIVHVHSVHSIFSVYAGLLVAESTSNTRLVVTPHYHGFGHTALRRLAWIAWRRSVSKLFRKASVVHNVSWREASLISSHYPEARGKIIVIPNGVEEDLANYKWLGHSSDYIIYAGRVEKYKRLEIAIEVAREIGLKFLIVGRGPYRIRFEKHAEKKYRDMVKFLEPQPRDMYLELLSKARYAINPSRQEAYSIFIAEALAMGVPSIVSREIAENLGAEIQPFNSQLVVALKAPIETWANITQLYLEKLYNG